MASSFSWHIYSLQTDDTAQPKHVGTRGMARTVLPYCYSLILCLSPDEYPFTTDLPDPVIPSLLWPKILYPNNVNVNPEILDFYTRAIVPALTRQTSDAIAALKRAARADDLEDLRDDGNHGSAATLDVELLGTLSKRVHYGGSSPIVPTTFQLMFIRS